MIGYHSIPVITDAYQKGIRDYDVEMAFEAMKHSARQDQLGLKNYKSDGYIPADKEPESVSKTLEYAYTRYFKTGGIFGPVQDCQQQVDKAVSVGVDEIAFLQDFGIDYGAVKQALVYLKQLIKTYEK